MVIYYWGELWDFALKTNAENHQTEAIFAGQKSPESIVSEKVSSGALIINFARTYFNKENP